MGTTKLNLKSFALTVLACLLLALPAMAKVTASGGTLAFTVLNTSLDYTLKVTGPGDFNHTETFAAGEPMVWTAKGADGRYKFDLTSIAAPRERGTDSPVKAKPIRITGSALLQGGLFVNADRPENLQKDIVHLDDVIIEFSLCVGTDCVNGENFGFDTLRLKENNLRIHFDDTSTSASFPKNDWRIIINDSGNGGASYFGVEDSTAGRIPFRVEAGAPVNTLYAEADGDVGIKTANPVVDLHIVEGNTPTLRLEQDGSDGFTPQTWDVAGNESNFFIRDVTNGSKLSFRIQPSAPESSIWIENTGDIGFGTNAPDADLHVRNTAATDNAELMLEANGQKWITRSSAGTGQFQLLNGNNNAQPFRVSELVTTNGLLQVGFDASNTENASRVAINGELDVLTAIFLNGNNQHPDYVFEPDYELETIEEHAAFMWSNKHLPALPSVGKEKDYRAPINVAAHQLGTLEELEKAHIYIDQLNQMIKTLEGRLDKLENSEE